MQAHPPENVDSILSQLLTHWPAFAAVLLLCLAPLLAGCSGVSKRLGPAGAAILGTAVKVYAAGTLRTEASEIMVSYLNRHPSSADRLPALNAAWKHFWDGGNPFNKDDFDAWRAEFLAERPTLLAHEVESFNAAADLLWEYLEAGADETGYIQVGAKTRRYVDAFVDGLRLGYGQWVAAR